MEHGAGGEGMRELLKLMLRYFNFNFNGGRGNDRVRVEVEVPLKALDDSAVVDNMVFTTDSHTVKPLFFPIGDHGVALLSFREGFGFDTKLKSDITPLNKMVYGVLGVGGVVAMKDPTRGGLANSLNEFSEKSKIGIQIEEERIPVRESVGNACEMLGIDPLEVGNEGKVVMGVVKEKAEDVLDALRGTEKGKNAEIIGSVTKEIKGVVMKTRVGGRRIVEPPIGDPVPRIC